LEDHVELKRLDPQYHLIFEGGGAIKATPDLKRLEQEIARLSPADARNVARFMAENRAKLSAFAPVLSQSFSKMTDMVSPAMLAALPHLRPAASVDRDLKRYFQDPRVRLAFSFQTKYLGMSPFQCPSLFTILSFLEYEHGVFHPWAAAARSPRRWPRWRAAWASTSASTRRSIASITRRRGEGHRGRRRAFRDRFRGGERRFRPRDPPPRSGGHAPALVGPQARQDEALLLDLHALSRARGDVGDLAHHTILLSREYERNIHEITNGILPDQPSVYVQNAGATDPTMAPKGHTSLYVLVPVPNLRCGLDWPALSAQYRQIALDRLKALGLKDVESRIRYERVVTPRAWESEFSVFEGATFNLAHNLTQMLYFRPHNRFGRNVYLVGGGTHPGSGLPVIYEGARITARLLMEDLERRRAGETAPTPLPAPLGEAAGA
jgi:phytoene desaturase